MVCNSITVKGVDQFHEAVKSKTQEMMKEEKNKADDWTEQKKTKARTKLSEALNAMLRETNPYQLQQNVGRALDNLGYALFNAHTKRHLIHERRQWEWIQQQARWSRTIKRATNEENKQHDEEGMERVSAYIAKELAETSKRFEAAWYASPWHTKAYDDRMHIRDPAGMNNTTTRNQAEVIKGNKEWRKKQWWQLENMAKGTGLAIEATKNGKEHFEESVKEYLRTWAMSGPETADKRMEEEENLKRTQLYQAIRETWKNQNPTRARETEGDVLDKLGEVLHNIAPRGRIHEWKEVNTKIISLAGNNQTATNPRKKGWHGTRGCQDLDNGWEHMKRSRNGGQA